MLYTVLQGENIPSYISPLYFNFFNFSIEFFSGFFFKYFFWIFVMIRFFFFKCLFFFRFVVFLLVHGILIRWRTTKIRFHQHHPEYEDYWSPDTVNTNDTSGELGDTPTPQKLPTHDGSDEPRTLQVIQRLLSVQGSILITMSQVCAFEPSFFFFWRALKSFVCATPRFSVVEMY